jgi:hypothetical protein
MEEWVKTLNNNSGAIVAVAATVSAVLTILLLLEARTTRNLRREAAVEARTRCHPPATTVLELNVRNFGPANARSVVTVYYLTTPDGEIAGDAQKHAETLLGPGEGPRFLPGPSGPTLDLREMAAQGLTLHVQWSWEDDRHRLWFFPLRHTAERAWACADLARDLYGGWSLSEHDSAEDLHEIADKLALIEMHQREGRQVLEQGFRASIRATTVRTEPSPAPPPAATPGNELTRQPARRRAKGPEVSLPVDPNDRGDASD